jgi:phytoene dehydrogenase-like protein
MHQTMRANPLIHQDELRLVSKYGLNYRVPDAHPDQRALIFWRDVNKTVESIAQFSKHDAEIYPKYIETCGKLLRAMTWGAFSPPPPFGTLVSLLDRSEEGRELLRVMLSSAQDMVEEWFESEQVQIAITRFASEAWVGPLEKGTGLNTFGFVPLIHRWGVGFAEGGSGVLTEKLEACLKDFGATIRISSIAKEIKIESNTARAVILSSGEEIRAKKAVVSNLNVKQLFLELLSPGELPAGFPEKIKNIRHSSFTAFNQALALNEAPRWHTGGDVDQACIVEITPLVDEYLKTFEDYTHGIPNATMPLAVCATLVDPTRAPQGKHTLYLYHYEPYELAGGGAARWDEVRQEIADSVIQTSRKYITNLGPENILGRWMASPLDLERTNPAFINGDCMHIGLFLSQYLSYRPLPGWGNYRTPVNNLYMCGASTHPGAGVTGGGRASVQVIMEDLGIDFKEVIG